MKHLSALFLVTLLLALGLSFDASAVRLPEHYAEKAEASRIKAIARVETVSTLESGDRFSTQETVFTLIKPYFGTDVPKRFSGRSKAVLYPWQKPGVGGDVYLYPEADEVVFVTVSEDEGTITSYTPLTDALEKALKEAPETVRYGFTSAYVGEAPNPAPNILDDWRRSRDTWAAMKARRGEDYDYVVGSYSWAGGVHRTRISVRQGRVVSRAYREEFRGPEEGPLPLSYEEDADSLGSHDKGAAPVTIDALYETCASDWLAKRAGGNAVQFLTDADGLLKHCSHRPPGCADDCDIGVSIEGIEWLND